MKTIDLYPFPAIMFYMLFIAQILTNAIGLLVAMYYMPGIRFEGDFKLLLVFGTVLGLINFLVKPLLKLIFIPLIILSIGTFGLVINAFLLWVSTKLIPNLSFDSYITIFFTACIITLLNIIVGHYFKKRT